ncbi:ATP-NAD kinase family protein, partial [Vibrio parahaemolyticus V-223/04]
HCKLNKVV